jgi:hypothetical protein
MFNKVETVTALSDFRLLISFRNGERKEYHVAPLLKKWSAFVALSDNPALFNLVKADPGGYGVSWNDDIDLSCDELYYNGLPC